MVEIYALARESFFGGQKSFQLQAYPFRMTARNMAKHRNSPHLAFWKNLKQGYDNFEVTKMDVKVDVCDRHYVFNAAQPEGANSSRPLAFNARGKCPAYEVPKEIAELVQEREEHDNTEYAELVASNISTMPSRAGIDGGMNHVFLAKLSNPNTDNNGRAGTTEVAVMQTPGALPRTPNQPSAQVVPPAMAETEPVTTVTLASATSEPAPSAPAKGTPQVRSGIANLIDNIFGTSEPAPVVTAQATPPRPVKKAATMSLAAAKQPHKPTVQAATSPMPALRPAVKEETAAAKPQQPAEPHEMRTAYTQPAPAQPSTMSGAQPVMPAGSFESRWSAFR